MKDKMLIESSLKSKDELSDNDSVVAKFAITVADWKKFQVEYYNLDMILSVGYRVKSKNGIIFRKWANKVLKDYMLKGYAVYQRRLKYFRKNNKINRYNKMNMIIKH